MRSPSPRRRTTRPWRSWHSRSPPKATPAPRRSAPSRRRSTGISWQACPRRAPSRRSRWRRPRRAFAKVGFGGDFGTAWQLTRRVGPAKAKELVFLAEILRADEVARLGLVNRVFPSDAFVAEVRGIARRLAHGPLVNREAITH